MADGAQQHHDASKAHQQQPAQERHQGPVETGGDPAECRILLYDFLASTAEDLAVLERQREAGDLHELARQAHKIKGASRLVGALELAETAAALEAAARNGEWPQVLPLTVDMHTAAEHLRMEMARRYSD